MKRKRISEVLNHLDDQVVEEAALFQKQIRHISATKVILIAACVATLLAAGTVVFALNPPTYPQPDATQTTTRSAKPSKRTSFTVQTTTTTAITRPNGPATTAPDPYAVIRPAKASAIIKRYLQALSARESDPKQLLVTLCNMREERIDFNLQDNQTAGITWSDFEQYISGMCDRFIIEKTFRPAFVVKNGAITGFVPLQNPKTYTLEAIEWIEENPTISTATFYADVKITDSKGQVIKERWEVVLFRGMVQKHQVLPS